MNEGFFHKFVIPINANWKNMFDILILFASVQNSFFQAYYSAFGLPTNELDIILDQSIEYLFWLDFIFCFFQEYQDEEAMVIFDDLKLIGKHYLKESCFFDFLACIPFYILSGGLVPPTEDPLIDKRRLF